VSSSLWLRDYRCYYDHASPTGLSTHVLDDLKSEYSFRLWCDAHAYVRAEIEEGGTPFLALTHRISYLLNSTRALLENFWSDSGWCRPRRRYELNCTAEVLVIKADLGLQIQRVTSILLPALNGKAAT